MKFHFMHFNSVVSSLFNGAKAITSGLEDLDRQYKRISSVLKPNEYNKIKFVKSLKECQDPDKILR